MDVGTITLIMGLVSCAIGISTFISGRMTKAESNGAMEAKINQAISGIEEINKKLERSSLNQHELELLVRSHEEQLKNLYRNNDEFRRLLDENAKNREVMAQLIQAISVMKEQQ